MKLGALACLFSDRSLDEAIKLMKEMGIETAEIGCGGATGDAHCKPAELLSDPAKIAAFKAVFEKYDMEISALDAHVNPVHPRSQGKRTGEYNSQQHYPTRRKARRKKRRDVRRLPRRARRTLPELDHAALAGGVRRPL